MCACPTGAEHLFTAKDGQLARPRLAALWANYIITASLRPHSIV